jgi:hypothetical protein
MHRDFRGKNEGKKQLGKPRSRWEFHVKFDFRAAECKCLDWIYLVPQSDFWRALVAIVINQEVQRYFLTEELLAFEEGSTQ